MACLEPEGMKEIDTLIDYYMGNAALLRQTMLDMGLKVHGGTDAPYVFVDLEGRSSWDMFSVILEETQVLSRPPLLVPNRPALHVLDAFPTAFLLPCMTPIPKSV